MSPYSLFLVVLLYKIPEMRLQCRQFLSRIVEVSGGGQELQVEMIHTLQKPVRPGGDQFIISRLDNRCGNGELWNLLPSKFCSLKQFQIPGDPADVLP